MITQTNAVDLLISESILYLPYFTFFSIESSFLSYLFIYGRYSLALSLCFEKKIIAILLYRIAGLFSCGALFVKWKLSPLSDPASVTYQTTRETLYVYVTHKVFDLIIALLLLLLFIISPYDSSTPSFSLPLLPLR